MSRVKQSQPKVNGILSDNSSKIDAIKELLFGDEFSGYDSELDSLKKDILRKKKELQNLIAEVQTELHQSIDDLTLDINKKINLLDKQLSKKADTLEDKKMDRKVLGSLLVKLGEKISQ